MAFAIITLAFLWLKYHKLDPRHPWWVRWETLKDDSRSTDCAYPRCQ